MKRQTGFTLVEIAIVLVVIGLLLGVILAGQEVVLNGKIRSAINEYNNIASATFIYQDRYRQFPGDDINASARWTDAKNGDASGTLEGDWDGDGTAASPVESRIFWSHLRYDGVIPGVADGTADSSYNLPQNAFNGQIGVQLGAFQGGGGSDPGINEHVICQTAIDQKAAIIIDTRIDDGDGAGSGSNSGALQGGNAGDINGGGPAASYSGSTGSFALCREMS